MHNKLWFFFSGNLNLLMFLFLRLKSIPRRGPVPYAMQLNWIQSINRNNELLPCSYSATACTAHTSNIKPSWATGTISSHCRINSDSTCGLCAWQAGSPDRWAGHMSHRRVSVALVCGYDRTLASEPTHHRRLQNNNKLMSYFKANYHSI